MIIGVKVMEEKKDIYILGIESSCDDTSAAVLRNGVLLSNVTASQEVHRAYGGVVPELASRAHQQNVVPVVDQAIKRAGITKEDLSAVAFTRGPGLMGSLLVGVSFAKGFARSLNIPLIDVNHLQGHVMAHFIKENDDDQSAPPFPFICLLVSGGNSQIVKVNAYNDMEVLGQTIDDAAGEAIDKCAKVLEWGYPGGPIVDKYARQGNPKAYTFAEPHIPGLNYSFSGFKTSFLYSLRKWVAADPDFVEKNKFDLAASIEFTIVDILVKSHLLKDWVVLHQLKTLRSVLTILGSHVTACTWHTTVLMFSALEDNLYSITFCFLCHDIYSPITLMSFQSTKPLDTACFKAASRPTLLMRRRPAALILRLIQQPSST